MIDIAQVLIFKVDNISIFLKSYLMRLKIKLL